jgi:hypothetical protein
MTQEEKDLLLKDLCARLPYGVKVNEGIQGDFTLIGLTKERVFTTCEVKGCHNDFPIELIKPYLFPLSSMTEEQKFEFHSLQVENSKGGSYSTLNECSIMIDWCYKNHIDINGLIPMDLAIDATGKNIY